MFLGKPFSYKIISLKTFYTEINEAIMKLYLDKPRLDKKVKINVLTYWKGNQFHYPELTSMTCDILSIIIFTLASKSTFSVINQFRSALILDIVESLICTRGWLY
jgi:hypothetical protein